MDSVSAKVILITAIIMSLFGFSEYGQNIFTQDIHFQDAGKVPDVYNTHLRQSKINPYNPYPWIQSDLSYLDKTTYNVFHKNTDTCGIQDNISHLEQFDVTNEDMTYDVTYEDMTYDEDLVDIDYYYDNDNKGETDLNDFKNNTENNICDENHTKIKTKNKTIFRTKTKTCKLSEYVLDFNLNQDAKAKADTQQHDKTKTPYVKLNLKTHGYYLTDFAVTFLKMFSNMIIIRLVFNVICHKIGLTNPSKISWNMISIYCLSYISVFSLTMIKNVILAFFYEMRQAFEKYDLHFVLTQRIPLPYTDHLINNMDYEEHSSKTTYACMLIITYFLYDIFVNRPRKEYMVHHFISIVSIMVYLFTQSYVFYICCGLFTEFSTIFLSISGLFETNGYFKKFLLGEFALTFFICRILFIPIVMIINFYIETGTKQLVVLVLFSAIYAMNTYWFLQIVQKVKKN